MSTHHLMNMRNEFPDHRSSKGGNIEDRQTRNSTKPVLCVSHYVLTIFPQLYSNLLYIT